jgi:hypothetical protein
LSSLRGNKLRSISSDHAAQYHAFLTKVISFSPIAIAEEYGTRAGLIGLP